MVTPSYFFGDDDPAQRLAKLDEFLGEFEQIPVAGPEEYVAPQPAWSEPRVHEAEYPANPREAEENKYMVSMNWLVPQVCVHARWLCVCNKTPSPSMSDVVSAMRGVAPPLSIRRHLICVPSCACMCWTTCWRARARRRCTRHSPSLAWAKTCWQPRLTLL